MEGVLIWVKGRTPFYEWRRQWCCCDGRSGACCRSCCEGSAPVSRGWMLRRSKDGCSSTTCFGFEEAWRTIAVET